MAVGIDAVDGHSARYFRRMLFATAVLPPNPHACHAPSVPDGVGRRCPALGLQG